MADPVYHQPSPAAADAKEKLKAKAASLAPASERGATPRSDRRDVADVKARTASTPGNHQGPREGEEAPPPPARAPLPSDRHPLGQGDVHDRLIALETHVRDITTVVEQARRDAAATSPPAVVTAPYVGQDGDLLTCTMGTWTGEPTSYAYQWRVDGQDIGTGSEQYVIQVADVGKSADCLLTATNEFGEGQSASNAVVVTEPVGGFADAPPVKEPA